MKKTMLATALLLVPFVSSAAITTYTNQGNWSAAAGTTSLYDFNSEADGSFTSRDFGDFTGTLMNQYDAITPAITSGELQLQRRQYTTDLKITFDSNISSFGFTWGNTDGSSDAMELNVLGQNFIFGPSLSSGFFGIVSTSLFTEALLSDSVGNGGSLSYGYVDNFQYGDGTGEVPIPAAAFMFAPALLGFMGLRRRAKNKAV